MGCGQSKINLYPRRNKSGGKGHGSKKSAGGDSKDGDEDETSGSAGSGAEAPREGNHAGAAGGPGGHSAKPRPPPAPPHALGHAASAEISASQLDFFKMLDEKIEKGRDYDSSSETEIQLEQARVTSLLQSWDAASQSSSQFCMATSSPPTPRSGRRIGRGNTPSSPPIRRGHHDSNSSLEKEQHKTGSPAKRAAQVANWKVTPKGQTQPIQMKPGQKLESCDDQRCYSPQLLTQREIHQSYGVSQEYTETSRDSSQITYNPTFQSHSPIHAAKNSAQSVSQPYIAQIITYPMSQQAVSYQSVGQKYITTSTTYQPPTPQQQQQLPPQLQQITQVVPPATVTAQQQQQVVQQRFPGRIQPGQQAMPPSNVYYIPPSPIVQPQIPPDQVLTTKQQTALHLQQYVAMKQAQQAMGYQRMMAGQDYSLYTQSDTRGGYGRKLYDRAEDQSYSLGFMTLGRQSVSQKAVLQTQVMRPMSPGMMQFQQSQIGAEQNPSQQIPFQRSQVNPNAFQNSPGCTASLGRNQSLLHHKEMMNERFGSGGMQSTTTTSQPPSSINITRNNVCQSLNIVTQKTVGQIVPIGTNQDLVIYQNVNDTSNSSGSVSRTSSNNSVVNASDMSTFKDVSKTITSNVDQSDLSKNIGRQVYYSQVLSSTAPVSDQNLSQKVVNSNNFIVHSAAGEVKKNAMDSSSMKNSVRTIVQNKNSMDKNGGEYL